MDSDDECKCCAEITEVSAQSKVTDNTNLLHEWHCLLDFY